MFTKFPQIPLNLLNQKSFKSVVTGRISKVSVKRKATDDESRQDEREQEEYHLDNAGVSRLRTPESAPLSVRESSEQR